VSVRTGKNHKTSVSMADCDASLNPQTIEFKEDLRDFRLPLPYEWSSLFRDVIQPCLLVTDRLTSVTSYQ